MGRNYTLNNMAKLSVRWEREDGYIIIKMPQDVEFKSFKRKKKSNTETEIVWLE